MTDDDVTTGAAPNPTRSPLFIALFAIDTLALLAFFVLPDPIRWVAAAVAFISVSLMLLLIRRAQPQIEPDADPGEPAGPTVY
jgi:hypothetical protein